MRIYLKVSFSTICIGYVHNILIPSFQDYILKKFYALPASTPWLDYTLFLFIRYFTQIRISRPCFSLLIIFRFSAKCKASNKQTNKKKTSSWKDITESQWCNMKKICSRLSISPPPLTLFSPDYGFFLKGGRGIG